MSSKSPVVTSRRSRKERTPSEERKHREKKEKKERKRAAKAQADNSDSEASNKNIENTRDTEDKPTKDKPSADKPTKANTENKSENKVNKTSDTENTSESSDSSATVKKTRDPYSKFLSKEARLNDAYLLYKVNKNEILSQFETYCLEREECEKAYKAFELKFNHLKDADKKAKAVLRKEDKENGIVPEKKQTAAGGGLNKSYLVEAPLHDYLTSETFSKFVDAAAPTGAGIHVFNPEDKIGESKITAQQLTKACTDYLKTAHNDVKIKFDITDTNYVVGQMFEDYLNVLDTSLTLDKKFKPSDKAMEKPKSELFAIQLKSYVSKYLLWSSSKMTV